MNFSVGIRKSYHRRDFAVRLAHRLHLRERANLPAFVVGAHRTKVDAMRHDLDAAVLGGELRGDLPELSVEASSIIVTLSSTPPWLSTLSTHSGR